MPRAGRPRPSAYLLTTSPTSEGGARADRASAPQDHSSEIVVQVGALNLPSATCRYSALLAATRVLPRPGRLASTGVSTLAEDEPAAVSADGTADGFAVRSVKDWTARGLGAADLQGRNRMKKWRMRFMPVAAAAILAFTFIGAIGTPAANATDSNNYIFTYFAPFSADPGYIVATGHGDIYSVTNDVSVQPPALISFTYPTVTPNGNSWYLMSTPQGCLNWDPSNDAVYDDSCVPGDPNELWYYNAYNTEYINLAGNEDTGHDTYLYYGDCLSSGSVNDCLLFASNTPFVNWETD
jgi:hypothetical protein